MKTNERHSNKDTSSRWSVLILGDRSYSRLLLIIVPELLILLVLLVVRGLQGSRRVRASLTLVGATLTLVLRLLQYRLLYRLLLQLLLLLLLLLHAVRHVRFIRTVHDLIGNDVVRRFRLELQQCAQMVWQIGRIVGLRLCRRLGPLVLLLSLTLAPGVTAWLLTRCGPRLLWHRDHGLGYRPRRRFLCQLLEMFPYLLGMTPYRGLFVESIIWFRIIKIIL